MNIFTFLLSFVKAIIPGFVVAQVWKQLAPGIDLQNLIKKKYGSSGDSHITIVRIDPDLWELVFVGISQSGEKSGKTTHDWCKSYKLTAAINAGIYADNYKTHVGYLRSKDHVNNSHINNYQSVMPYYPKNSKKVPSFRIFDLDEPGISIQSIEGNGNAEPWPIPNIIGIRPYENSAIAAALPILPALDKAPGNHLTCQVFLERCTFLLPVFLHYRYYSIIFSLILPEYFTRSIINHVWK